MELLSIKFPGALMATLNSDSVMLGTLPEQQQKAQRDHHVVAEVKGRKDVKVARLTRNNREALAPQVYGWLRESLGLLPPGEVANKKKEAAAAAAAATAATAAAAKAKKSPDA